MPLDLKNLVLSTKSFHPMITSGRDIIAQAQSGNWKNWSICYRYSSNLSNLDTKVKDNKVTSAIILLTNSRISKANKRCARKNWSFYENYSSTLSWWNISRKTTKNQLWIILLILL